MSRSRIIAADQYHVSFARGCVRAIMLVSTLDANVKRDGVVADNPRQSRLKRNYFDARGRMVVG